MSGAGGWDRRSCPALGCFPPVYGGTVVWSATLHIGLSGLLAPVVERVQATVPASEAELRSGSTVYRYNRDDALPGGEGGFHLCASWLVEAYLGGGRRTEAVELFQQIVDAAGPTGLLPEEYDPITER